MHCDMLKIQDGGAIVEKVNWENLSELATILTCFDKKQQFFSNTLLKRKKATAQRTQNTEAI